MVVSSSLKREIKSSRYGAAIILVVFIIFSASYLLSSYNMNTRKLSLPVVELQLGENEHYGEEADD